MDAQNKAKKAGKIGHIIKAPFRGVRELYRLGDAYLGAGIPAMLAVVALMRKRSPRSSYQELFKAMSAEFGSEAFMNFLDKAGPLYGKSIQILFSRMDPNTLKIFESMSLTRVYDDWPAMPINEVENLMDKELPGWRKHFKSPALPPLGVASMGQVHIVEELSSGKKWVVKILKPRAKMRMQESLDAVKSLLAQVSLFTFSRGGRKALNDLVQFADQSQAETDLRHEKKSMERIRDLCSKKSIKNIVIPEVYPKWNSQDALVMEYLDGVSLKDLVEGKSLLSKEHQQEIARSILGELLVQVFDLGFFHADPHAGNMILMMDGRIGLMDWGFAGELSNKERAHISKILRALMRRDLKMLAQTLHEMAVDSGNKNIPSVTKIWSELQKILAEISKEPHGKNFQNLSIQQVVSLSFGVADRLNIFLPQGLLAMMKTLVTAEGLAKGIDPKISLVKVAGPVLMRAANPGLLDFLHLIWRNKN